MHCLVTPPWTSGQAEHGRRNNLECIDVRLRIVEARVVHQPLDLGRGHRRSRAGKLVNSDLPITTTLLSRITRARSVAASGLAGGGWQGLGAVALVSILDSGDSVRKVRAQLSTQLDRERVRVGIHLRRGGFTRFHDEFEKGVSCTELTQFRVLVYAVS